MLTLLIVFLMLRRRRPKVSPAAQEVIDAVGADETSETAGVPQQTTTFSIFELGVLSRNKKYVDEINRDIEERLEADRLEARKKELRRKELEEMGRRVYGSDEDAETEDAAVEDAPSEAAPAADPEHGDKAGFVEVPVPTDEPAPADPTPLEPIKLFEEEDNG